MLRDTMPKPKKAVYRANATKRIEALKAELAAEEKVRDQIEAQQVDKTIEIIKRHWEGMPRNKIAVSQTADPRQQQRLIEKYGVEAKAILLDQLIDGRIRKEAEFNLSIACYRALHVMVELIIHKSANPEAIQINECVLCAMPALAGVFVPKKPPTIKV
jgi:hypothetical protein